MSSTTAKFNTDTMCAEYYYKGELVATNGPFDDAEIGQRDCMLTEAFWNNPDVNPNDVPFGQHKDLVISKPEMPKEFEPTAGITPTA